MSNIAFEVLPIQIDVLKGMIFHNENTIIPQEADNDKKEQLIAMISDLKKEIVLAEESLRDWQHPERAYTHYENFRVAIEKLRNFNKQ